MKFQLRNWFQSMKCCCCFCSRSQIGNAWLSTCNKSHANFGTEFHCLQISDRISLTSEVDRFNVWWKRLTILFAHHRKWNGILFTVKNQFMIDWHTLFMNATHSFIRKFLENWMIPIKFYTFFFFFFDSLPMNKHNYFSLKHMPTQAIPKNNEK